MSPRASDSTQSLQGPTNPVLLGARRILLIHFGQMGDAVLALPAALALRGHAKEADVGVVAGHGGAEIFRMAGFETVWPVDRARWKGQWWTAPGAIAALVVRLRAWRPQLSVDLHSYKETNLLAWATGAPQRLGMWRATRSWPWLMTLKAPLDDHRARLLDRYCRVLEPLGIEVADRQPRLTPPPAAQSWAEAALPAGAGPWLGICPGAGHPSRRWPAAAFAAIARELATLPPPAPRPLLLVGPEEQAAPENARLAPLRALPGVREMAGLTVPQLASVLARCRLVLANASGPAHIAAAVGAAVVTIGEIPAFDPVGASARRVVPVRAQGSVAEVPVVEVLSAARMAWSAEP